MSKFKITFQAKLVKGKFYITMRINLALKDRYATKKAVKKGKTINTVVTINDNYKSVYVGIPISFKEKSEWNSAAGRFNGTDIRNIQLDNLKNLSSEVVEKNIQLIDYYNTTILKELIKKIVLGKRTKEFKLQVQNGKIYDTDRPDKNRFPMSKTHPRSFITGEVESIVQDLSNIVQFQRDKQALLKMSLSTFIENTWNDWKKTKKKAANTARTYQNSVSWIKKFEKQNNRQIKVADFNQAFAEEYYLWAKRQRKTDGKPYKVNYISDLRKQLQVISGELKSVYGHNTNIDWKSGDTLKKSREKSVDIALNKNQIKQLFGYKIPDAAPKGMHNAFALIKIGIWTGMRISDLLLLNLIEKDGKVHVDQTLQKTGVHVTFVTHPIVKQIWESYNRKLPKIMPDDLATYFRDIGENLGWTHFHHYTRKPTVKGGKIITIQERFCDMLKTSTLRRTWASLALNTLKLAPSEIIKVTGHSTIGQLFEYVRADIEELNQKLESSYDDFQL